MSEPRIVIVFTGHRDARADPALFEALDREFPLADWRTGGARQGFDCQADDWIPQPQVYRPRYRPIPPPDDPAWVLKVPGRRLPGVPWEKIAPLKRNEELLEGRGDDPPAWLVIACWDGREHGGTFYTKQYAEMLKIPVRVWEPVR